MVWCKIRVIITVNKKGVFIVLRKDRQKLKKQLKKIMSQREQAIHCNCSESVVSRWYDAKIESKPLKEKLLKLYEAINE